MKIISLTMSKTRDCDGLTSNLILKIILQIFLGLAENIASFGIGKHEIEDIESENKEEFNMMMFKENKFKHRYKMIQFIIRVSALHAFLKTDNRKLTLNFQTITIHCICNKMTSMK
jgi:hypothetical protein